MEPAFASGAEQVYRSYLSFTQAFPFGLGGRLLFAGELASATPLLRAANVAGAASLAASANSDAQRQAMRDGVVDFLVTSLDEALRILKNEIRKHKPVSVAVSIEPSAITAQMLERGVLPDLIATEAAVPGSLTQDRMQLFLQQGATPLAQDHLFTGPFVRWSVDRDFSRWMPHLDACARSVLPPGDEPRQRWLRLAPRYLGREAQRLHGIAMNAEELRRFREVVLQMFAREVKEEATAPEVSIDL